MKVYINGKFYSKNNAKISVFDHGLLYGDGVFEGIRSYNRRVFKLKEHIDRLFESAHSLMIKPPLSKSEIIKAVIKTLKTNSLNNAYIRLVVTRGEGDLGLDPRKCVGNSTVIIITDKISLYPERLYKKGLKIITVPTIRNHPEALNPQVKSLNYLINYLKQITQQPLEISLDLRENDYLLSLMAYSEAAELPAISGQLDEALKSYNASKNVIHEKNKYVQIKLSFTK